MNPEEQEYLATTFPPIEVEKRPSEMQRKVWRVQADLQIARQKNRAQKLELQRLNDAMLRKNARIANLEILLFSKF